MSLGNTRTTHDKRIKNESPDKKFGENAGLALPPVLVFPEGFAPGLRAKEVTLKL